jgi:hypothetical protein
MQFPCALGNWCAKKILLLPLSPKYARFLQVYGIIVKSKDLNLVNFSLLLWATVIERICAQMYYSPVSQFLANLLPGVALDQILRHGFWDTASTRICNWFRWTSLVTDFKAQYSTSVSSKYAVILSYLLSSVCRQIVLNWCNRRWWL